MDDTICAVATGQSNGAISIIRMSGSEAIPIINSLMKENGFYAELYQSQFAG